MAEIREQKRKRKESGGAGGVERGQVAERRDGQDGLKENEEQR